jgi:uncharacterized protein
VQNKLFYHAFTAGSQKNAITRIPMQSTGRFLTKSLLGIKTIDDLLSHPMMGYSWEGFVLEHICQPASRGAELMFYRTASGAEMDAVVQFGSKTICFEIKSSSAPKVSQGFYNAMQDLKPSATFIVAQVDKRYAFSEQVEVIPLADLDDAEKPVGRSQPRSLR